MATLVDTREFLSRRRFLAGTARVTAGAATLGLLARTGWAAERVASVPAKAWEDLARRLSPNALLRPGEVGFGDAALPNNLRYAGVVPDGIAMCKSARDVAQSILWCRENDVALAPRSGGHNYAGYSTTTGLLIDVSPMNSAAFDPSSGIVTVGGGARNANLYTYLPQFNAAVTHGRCRNVGVAGLVLGGGIGFNMRARGLTCDQLVETQLVTADGQVRTANEKENSGLYWACRGGAGNNFGVNTQFRFQTFPVGDITAFNIKWTKRPEAVYRALLGALQKGPKELGSRVGLLAVTPEQLKGGEDVSVLLLGQLVGTIEEARDILAPAFRIAEPDPRQNVMVHVPYWQAQNEVLSEDGTPGYYQERSRFFPGPLPEKAIDTAFHWARRWPGTSVQGETQMALFQTGATVNATQASKTAFVHRDSDWLMTIQLHWGGGDSERTLRLNHEWQNGFYRAMLPFTRGGAYQNFPDPSLIDWKRDYYGANLEKLETIKAMVDPRRAFNYAQAIPPA